MALTPRLDLRTNQRLGLALSSSVLGALQVLRMSAADLADLLAAEAAANPFLLPGLPPPISPTTALTDADLPADQADWQQDLLRQLALMALPARVAAVAAVLVGELDERGWLDVDLDRIAQDAQVGADLLAAALAAVQACDPPGVGARDLTECLALQLIDMGLTAAAAQTTLAELPRFARRDHAGLMAALGLDRAGVSARAAMLRRLTPNPVQGAGRTAATPILRPDLVWTQGPGGTARVDLAADHLPRPRVDASLARRAAADGFGVDLLARAQALVRAVDSRGATLARVGQWLADRQGRALASGSPAALVPARRAQAAADLGLHPSTVGRAAAGKAMLAGGRLWPLATLFAGGGDAGAGPAIAAHIAQLIAAEPPARPLTDARLAAILALEGVDIARRTVAKYRNGLRIPPAHRRRDPD